MSIICELFPGQLQKMLSVLEGRLNEIQEIRLRVGRPLIILIRGKEHFISMNGQVINKPQEGMLISKEDMEVVIMHICRTSVYAYEEEIRKGFITVKGGHRVGISGQAVLAENGELKTIKNISFMNIRIAHEVKGVANKWMHYMYEKGRIHNTLIISPPGFGKTTLLRDIIRNISNGSLYAEGRTCSIIDERSELAGCYNGIPQLDVGMRTDVMDACPKSLGMMMAIRSMAPQIVAVDELGTTEDIKALFSVIRSGCSILATVHGDNIESLNEKSFLKEVMNEKVFTRYFVIANQKHEINVYNGEFEKC